MQITNTILFLLPFAGALAASAGAQTTVDTFTGGVNQGGWTFGNGFDTIESTGGNPGAHLRNPNLDTFAPQLRTSGSSVFTGDWRTQDVSAFGVDLRTYSTQFPFEREATLLLVRGDIVDGCSVYYLGTDLVPQPHEGWKSFDYAIDSSSTSLPPGWAVLNGCGDADATWNTVITDVTQVILFYGHPEFFFIFDVWNVGADNARITSGPASYCTPTPNSTGAPALIGSTGSTSVAANDLSLVAEPVPASQFGVFFYGPEAVELPFGNGFLCVGPGSIGLQRLPLVHSGPRGELRHALDLTSPPTAAGQIRPGSTWYFQAWFRDPAARGAAHDTSDGLRVSFQP